MDDRAMLPSEKAEKRAEAEKLQNDRAEARLRNLRQDFMRTFQTASGKRVLQWIRQRCGHNKVILSADNSGEIDQLKTTFAAMELNFYLAIRQFLTTELLKEIENGSSIEPSGSIAEPITGNTIERRNRRDAKSR